MIRSHVQQLLELGPLPNSADATDEQLRAYEHLLEDITRPISNEEAKQLVGLFGSDDCFGLAWTIIHRIESALDWPIYEALENDQNPWILLLKSRAERRYT